MATEDKKVEGVTTKDKETKVETSQVQVTDKKYTEDDVNQMISKRLKKEKAKTEEAKKETLTLEDRLKIIEKERKAEKAEKEISEQLLINEKTANREINVSALISDKVNENYIENVTIIVNGKISPTDTLEEIGVIVDKVIASLPNGVLKGSSNGSTVIGSIEVIIDKDKDKEKEKDEDKVVFTSNTGVEYTDEKKVTELGKKLFNQMV